MLSVKDSALFNGEFFLLLFTVITLVCSLSGVYRKPTIYLNQLDSLEESIQSLINCNVAERTDQTQSATENHRGEFQRGLTSHNASDTPYSMPVCPIDKDRLKYFDDYELNDRLDYRHVEWGGRFKPDGCRSSQRVAIVVPYRNRQEHLEKFSLYIHQFLPDQLIDYSIYVIQQNDSQPFNRAKLFNVGVAEITKIDPTICCFIFHDVDLLPLDQRNLYMCSTRPKHLSPGVSTLRYKLLYSDMFGGVISMTRSQFEAIGGFSNAFYGWGGEDDDIFRRVRAAGLGIERAPEQLGVYLMLTHSKMVPNPLRFQLLEDSEQSVMNDAPGATATYKLNSIVEDQLFTIISVEL